MSSTENYEEHVARIYNYLDLYDLNKAQEHLWKLILQTMQSADVDDWDGFRRTDALLFYQQTKELIESIYWIAIPLLEHFGHKLPPGIYDAIPKCPHCSNSQNQTT